MDERRCFVQFIHPGGEHRPDNGDLKFWNRADHRRKFLKSPGSYLVDDEVAEGEIVFWGEWEPESRVVRRYQQPLPDGPGFLYEPYYVERSDGLWRQNTDPFVFGERFHYTGCMQHTSRGPTQLRYLAPGSLILFGSCRQKSRFVVDTLFVVADHIDHTADDRSSQLEQISATYRAVTIEPWYSAPKVPHEQSHRLYFGATPDQPMDGMFSFFPCKPLEDRNRGFARPDLQIPCYVTPNLYQGRKVAKDLEPPKLRDLWRDVVRQVEAQGLVLGVRAELPPERTEAEARGKDPPSRERC